MASYYLDIETTGIEPSTNKILTIQFIELDRTCGLPLHNKPITILKEWETNEEQLLKTFSSHPNIQDQYPFSFVSIGYNLKFERNFIYERCKHYNLTPIDIFKKPTLDLHPIGVLMNRGEFRGSGLDKITGKEHSGAIIPEWYHTQQYHLIENYITNETNEFIKWYAWLLRKMPNLHIDFKTEHNLL